MCSTLELPGFQRCPANLSKASSSLQPFHSGALGTNRQTSPLHLLHQIRPPHHPFTSSLPPVCTICGACGSIYWSMGLGTMHTPLLQGPDPSVSKAAWCAYASFSATMSSYSVCSSLATNTCTSSSPPQLSRSTRSPPLVLQLSPCLVLLHTLLVRSQWPRLLLLREHRSDAIDAGICLQGKVLVEGEVCQYRGLTL